MTRISRDAYGLKLAEAAASRADCTRRQVGAVIVAEDGSVISTGYNGLASGLPGCASAGACPRGQMAYPTREWTHGTLTPSRVDITGPPEYPADVGYEETGCRAVHAEVNAIIRAGRDRCVGATIYVTDEPCFHCSVVIEGAGIGRTVTPTTEDETQVWSLPTPGFGANGYPLEHPSNAGTLPTSFDTPSFPALPTDADLMDGLRRAVERQAERRRADRGCQIPACGCDGMESHP